MHKQAVETGAAASRRTVVACLDVDAGRSDAKADASASVQIREIPIGDDVDVEVRAAVCQAVHDGAGGETRLVGQERQMLAHALADVVERRPMRAQIARQSIRGRVDCHVPVDAAPRGVPCMKGSTVDGT
jgi:hypothetical protein